MRIEWVDLADIKAQAEKESRVIGWQFYMYDWCNKQRAQGVGIIVTENGRIKYDYTGAQTFEDKRRPNEYLTTD